MVDGKVKVNETTVRVIGADPAPKGGIDYFDGKKFGKVKAESDCRKKFADLSDNNNINLIAWDASISFERENGFSSRPIELTACSTVIPWLKEAQNEHLMPGAVSVLPFSQCSHWAITCECLGMPYENSKKDSVQYEIAETRNSLLIPNKTTRFVIEVHPAVSMAVWWVAKNLGDTPFPQYKGSKKQKDAVKIIRNALQTAGLISDEVEESKEDNIWDDNQLDAWVAWKMGVDFLTGDAVWIGSPHEGGFVLPKEADNPELMGIKRDWQNK